MIEGDELEAAAKSKPAVIAAPAFESPPRPESAAPVAEPHRAAPPAVASTPPPAPVPRAEAVLPLVHAPDDPGPEASPDLDPEPGTSTGSRGLRLF